MISSFALKKCKLKLIEETTKKTAIFPFFDTEGIVQQLMFLLPQKREIYFLPRKGNIKASFYRTLTMDKYSLDLIPVSDSNLTKISQLWHFDPWWLLQNPPYCNNENVTILKKTNCANRMSLKVHNFYFDHHLEKISSLIFMDKSGEAVYQKFSKAKIVFPKKQKLKVLQEASWQFDPIWKNW